MAWYNSSWPYRKKITIDHTKVSASDQTDFPVCVRITGDANIAAAAQYNGNDILFTSSDGTTKLSHDLVEYNPEFTNGNGAWSWFSNPRAVYYNGKTYVGTVNAAGDVLIYQYVHSSGTMNSFTLVSAFEADDHDHPAIYVRTDGKILVIYAKHSTDTTIRYRLSTNAEDISAWGAVQFLTGSGAVSYSNPRYLSGFAGGTLFNIYRINAATPRYWAYVSSTTEGSSWGGAEVAFWDGGVTLTPYMHSVVNGANRIDFVASDAHPNDAAATSLYHFYLDTSSGSKVWKKSDGTTITTGDPVTPLTPADVTLVYDGSTTKAWNWDIAIDGSNNPVIAYATFTGASFPSVEANSRNHRYNVARYSAGWTSAEVCAGGKYIYTNSPSGNEFYYSGGMVLDPADTNTIYCCREVVTDTWRVEKYTWNGSAWSLDSTISHRDGKHFRPTIPKNADSSLQLLWCSGYYDWWDQSGSITYFEPFIWTYPRIAQTQSVLVADVKVPTLSASADTILYLYYGNTAAADQSDAGNVDDANCLGAWNVLSPTNTRQWVDRTGNARHFTLPNATPSGFNDPHPYPGKVLRAGALRFGHITANDGMDASTTINLAGLSQFEIECWFNLGALAAGDAQEIFDCFSGTTTAGALFRVVQNQLYLGGFVVRQADTQIGGSFTDLVLSAGTAAYVGLLFDAAGTGLTAQMNATLSGTAYTSGGAAMDAGASPTAYVGRRSSGANGYLTSNAVVERLRIHNTVRSAGWRTTRYNNESSPSTFFAVAGQETPSVIGGGGTLLGLLRRRRR